MIVEDLLSTGSDALKSQFDVVFPSGIPGGGNSVLISLRMRETIDPPEHGVQVYEIFRKGQKIPRPGGAEEVDKMITVNVDLDQQWIVYDDLKKWKELVYNSSTGVPGQTSKAQTTMEIVSYNEDSIPIHRLIFRGTFLSKMKVQDFDNQSPDQQKLELTFHFAKMEDG
jgi:hypothetical protein